jgi:RimJ/RimL family protein N-acetyltransferase
MGMLRSKDVYLSPPAAEDSAALFRWINDRDEVLHSSGYKPVSPASHDVWFASVQERGDTAFFAIRLAESNRLIGTCQLTGIHPVYRSAELRIRIGEGNMRGKGCGTQALQLLLKFGFHDLNLHRIWLHVFTRNDAACRVYRKLGFTDEGVLRDAAFLDGRYEAIRVMSLLEDEYARCHPSA